MPRCQLPSAVKHNNACINDELILKLFLFVRFAIILISYCIGDWSSALQRHKLQFNLFLEFFVFKERSLALCKGKRKPKTARIRHLVAGSHEPVAKCQMFVVNLDNKLLMFIYRVFSSYKYVSRFFVHKQILDS